MRGRYLVSVFVIIVGFVVKGYCQGGQPVQNGNMEQWEVKALYPRLFFYSIPNTYYYMVYDTVAVLPATGVGGVGKSAQISIIEAMGDTLQGFVMAQKPDTSELDSFSIWVKCQLAPGDTALILLLDDIPGGGFNYVCLVQLWDTISVFEKRTSIKFGSCSSCDTLRFITTWATGGSKGTPGSTFWIDSLVFYRNGSPVPVLPNQGFEMWDSVKTQYPTNWFALKDYTEIDNDPFGDVFSVEPSTDAIEGTYSAKLIPRVSAPFIPVPIMSALIYGVDKKWILQSDYDPPIVPFSDTPDTLVFSYKTIGTPQNDSIYILFSRWDTMAGQRDTLFFYSDSLSFSSSWNTVRIPLNLSNKPDSMGLAFGCWGNIADGSVYLLIDNVHFIYTISGVPYIELLMEDDQVIYPSHKKLYIKRKEGVESFESLELYDLTGSKVFTMEFSSPVQEITLPQTLASGVYVYHLYGKSNQQPRVYIGKIWISD